MIVICIVSISLLSFSLITGTGFTTTTKMSPAIKVSDPVAPCKANVMKYVPIGAYPGGYNQVKAALAYCDSLA